MDHRLKFILLVSVSLNLLLIGIVLGYFLRGPGFKHRPPHLPPHLSQRLSPEKKQVFDSAMRSLAEKNKGIARQLEQKRAEILSVLTAESFDPQAFQQKSLELHELHGEMKGQLDQTLEKLASEFNREEREALAELLRQGPPPPPGAPPQGGPRGFPPPGPPPPL